MPELVDRVRGKVMPAWGSGILYTDYVINGGLNPVDAVTSGVYLYGIASFARLVAEHPDPERRTAYRDDAIKFANAAVETMWAFMPEWDTRQAGSFVEGTIFRPRRFPTADECDAANARAKEHVRLYDPKHLEGLSKLFDDNKPDCEDVQRLCRQTTGAQRERGLGDVVHRAVALPRQRLLSHVAGPHE